MGRRVKSRGLRLAFKLQIWRVSRRFLKTVPVGFQMTYNSVPHWVESRGLARMPSCSQPLIKTRVGFPVLCSLSSLGRFYSCAHLPLLINSPKRKAGEKDPTLHNPNHTGRRQSRAFTKNSDVQCDGQTSKHRLQIPNELCPFPHFLFRHLKPAPKCIAFGFFQSTQLSFQFMGQGTEPKVIPSLKTHPVPPSITPSHLSPIRPLQSFPLPLSF